MSERDDSPEDENTATVCILLHSFLYSLICN
jgi:hypothetical protein